MNVKRIVSNSVFALFICILSAVTSLLLLSDCAYAARVNIHRNDKELMENLTGQTDDITNRLMQPKLDSEIADYYAIIDEDTGVSIYVSEDIKSSMDIGPLLVSTEQEALHDIPACKGCMGLMELDDKITRSNYYHLALPIEISELKVRVPISADIDSNNRIDADVYACVGGDLVRVGSADKVFDRVRNAREVSFSITSSAPFCVVERKSESTNLAADGVDVVSERMGHTLYAGDDEPDESKKDKDDNLFAIIATSCLAGFITASAIACALSRRCIKM